MVTIWSIFILRITSKEISNTCILVRTISLQRLTLQRLMDFQRKTRLNFEKVS
jgi:hypothetical protein